MKHLLDISNEEIQEIAKKQNKSVEEIMENLKFAIKDLEYTEREIALIIEKNKYITFPNNIDIHGYGKKGELNTKYMCYDNISNLKGTTIEDLALVTGFGPTNAPTAGTLSMIFRIIEMQQKTGIYTHVIISDLGALNSRQKSLKELLNNTKQFKKFIEQLGFDLGNGEIRTHNDYDHSRTFSIVSSVLKIKDFIDNGEVTDEMYKRLNIQGNDFSTMVDQTFTVADIVLPIIRDGKKSVIVSAGLEEHYYPYLSRIVLERLKLKTGGVEVLVDKQADVGALYGKLISGFFPYVKMSKSIPESSVNLGDSESDIYEKILNNSSRNEFVVLQMIELASNWNVDKIKDAQNAFTNRSNDFYSWYKIKKEYADFFIHVKRIWDKCKCTTDLDIKDEIFY